MRARELLGAVLLERLELFVARAAAAAPARKQVVRDDPLCEPLGNGPRACLKELGGPAERGVEQFDPCGPRARRSA